MFRSIVASLIALVLLAGCSTLQHGAIDAMKLAVDGKQDIALTPERVAVIPYAQLHAETADGDAVLILGNVDDDRQAWYSATGEIVFLRDGVVTKTVGLSGNIVATRFPAGDPFAAGLQHLHAPVTTAREFDLDGYRYGVAAQAELVPGVIETVDILGAGHQLRRVDEHLSAPGIGFAADNVYWVDPVTGVVWKSRQAIPGGPVLTLTLLRPYLP
jgi:hypothetical protein